MTTPPGQSKKYDIDPAPCNALTLTQHGLRVPRTDYTGIAPGGNVGPERSVDIDVQMEEGCPRSVTIGARLTPVSGISSLPNNVDLLTRPNTWVNLPGTDLVLPEAGIYALDANVRGYIHSLPPHHSWIIARIYDVMAGSAVPHGTLWVTSLTAWEGPTPLPQPPVAGDLGVDSTTARNTLYRVTGSTTVRLQALYNPTPGRTDLMQADIASVTGEDWTSLRMIKVSD
jgi:hypothetical protein